MSGTSLDGIDAVKLLVKGEGYRLTYEVLDFHSIDYPSVLRTKLKDITLLKNTTIQSILECQHAITESHLELFSKFKNDYDLITLHGQTLYHNPPISWQAINPNPIVAKFNKTVVYDLRAADLAHAGQGAPITPLADAICFQNENEARSIVNLGGFINITHLNSGPFNPSTVEGHDVCICNQWLDQLSKKYFNHDYDDQGNFASQGQLNKELEENMFHYFKTQWKKGVSLGSQDDQNHSLQDMAAHEPDPNNLLYSSCHALARIILKACESSNRLILAGGGCHNKTLIKLLKESTKQEICLSDAYGMPFQQREAIEMALLGALCQDKISITLPQITKSSHSPFLSGSWIFPSC